MAKFHGVIGYGTTEKTAPGVYKDAITERNYTGDVIRDNRRLERGESVNDNLNLSNQFSVVGDAFAYANFQTMKYITWNGARWKITNVEINRPRLTLTVGGVYNAS
jgi:hypothetical protein